PCSPERYAYSFVRGGARVFAARYHLCSSHDDSACWERTRPVIRSAAVGLGGGTGGALCGTSARQPPAWTLRDARAAVADSARHGRDNCAGQMGKDNTR